MQMGIFGMMFSPSANICCNTYNVRFNIKFKMSSVWVYYEAYYYNLYVKWF